MRKNKLQISLLIFSVLLFSCTTKKKFSAKKDLLLYIHDEANGLSQTKTVNGVSFRLTYRPTDVIVDQELRDYSDKKMIDSLRKLYNEYMYINLDVSKNGQELLNHKVREKREFGRLVNDLAFNMKDKVFMFTQNKDTIEMIDYIYPRMYGGTKSTSLMFVYPKNEKMLNDKNIILSINDIGFKTGEVKLRLETDKILNEPELTFVR